MAILLFSRLKNIFLYRTDICYWTLSIQVIVNVGIKKTFNIRFPRLAASTVQYLSDTAFMINVYICACIFILLPAAMGTPSLCQVMDGLGNP